MSEYLYCELMLSSAEAERYWWPLVFEATRRSNFCFSRPDDPARQGVYFSAEEMDVVASSFQAMWKKIYDQQDHMLISFWLPPITSLWMQASVDQEGPDIWRVAVTIENGLFYEDESAEERKQIIRAFLHCVAYLCDLCRPETITLDWHEVYGYARELNLCAVRDKEKTEALPPLSFYDQKLLWRQVATFEQEEFFIVDPLPIWARGRWNYISWTEDT